MFDKIVRERVKHGRVHAWIGDSEIVHWLDQSHARRSSAQTRFTAARAKNGLPGAVSHSARARRGSASLLDGSNWTVRRTRRHHRAGDGMFHVPPRAK